MAPTHGLNSFHYDAACGKVIRLPVVAIPGRSPSERATPALAPHLLYPLPVKPMARRFFLLLATLAATLGPVAPGCAIKPQPEPPPVDSPTVDLDSVLLSFSDGEAPVEVRGMPGSVSHPGALVRAFNLDSNHDPVEALVLDDGSFLFTIFGDTGDEVRLQVITPDARSKPVDFSLTESPVPSTRALGNCLTLTPPLELVTASSAHIIVRNDCSFAVQLDTPVMRRPIDGIDVGTGSSWPATLDPGTSLSVPVTITATAFEDVVLFPFSSPEQDRRPITLRNP